MNIPELYAARAPGNTCISAIAGDNFGSVENPSNNSKGCGGVMRVAPVGLYLGGHSLDSAKAAYMGAQIAALTHGHPLGYIPAPHW